MRKLDGMGIKLPDIYIAESREDAIRLQSVGLPYIKTQLSDREIVMLILYRMLVKRFPHIKWSEVLHVNLKARVNVIVPGGSVSGKAHAEHDPEHELSDIAGAPRTFDVEGTEGDKPEHIAVADFCADEASHVNIEQLQALGLLPKFMDDIADSIRLNLEDRMRWRECWNKRLGAAVGDVSYGMEKPNLIILDISNSIPEGISATMIQLIETLRDRASADLIVTGSTSMFWAADEELPSPEWIRGHIARCNESKQFIRILKTRIAGRHFGNVISFGDYDAPYYRWHEAVHNARHRESTLLQGTSVDRVVNYHTYKEDWTGYAAWVQDCSPDAEVVFDTRWCKVMR